MTVRDGRRCGDYIWNAFGGCEGVWGTASGTVGQLLCVSLDHNQRAVFSFLIIISVSRMYRFKISLVIILTTRCNV